MNKKYLTISLFLYTLIPNPGIAAIQDITVNWSMTNITLQEVQEFQIFSNYTDIETNKVQLANCSDATEVNGVLSMTCNNVNIEQYPTHFSIVAIMPNADNIESGVWDLAAPAPTISPVQGFSLELPNTSTPPPNLSSVFLAVNFQEGSNTIPTGFVKDYGQSYDSSNSPDYGWLDPLPTDTRDRNNTLSPDQSYDTFILAYPNHTWEAAVPNGTYKVSVCAGDVSYPGNSIHSLQVEGVSLITPEATTTDNRWILKDLNVNVNDGRITITFLGANQFTAFCWIKIESI